MKALRMIQCYFKDAPSLHLTCASTATARIAKAKRNCSDIVLKEIKVLLSLHYPMCFQNSLECNLSELRVPDLRHFGKTI